jgi:hypothetical protein
VQAKTLGGVYMKEFLNPKSMLTPGVAGSLMMFLVNGIAFQFPEIPPRYLALVLSFIIGSIIWFSESSRTSVFQKSIFWILNSLVILVVGFGTSNLAANATTRNPVSETPQTRILTSNSTLVVKDHYESRNTISGLSLHPLPPPPLTQFSSSRNQQTLREQLEAEKVKNEKLVKQLKTFEQEKAKQMQPVREKQFFKQW